MMYFLLLLSLTTFAQDENFQEILNVQSEALESISTQKGLPGGYQFTEMITDLGVSKQGILGFSALKAGVAVEIKWKRKTTQKNYTLTPDAQVTIPQDASPRELTQYSEAIAEIVETSGKVQTTQLKEKIQRALTQVQAQIGEITYAQFGGWELGGFRVDLNFGANGEISFISRVGTSVRVRLEWSIVQRNKQNVTSQSLLVGQILKDLDSSALDSTDSDFKAVKVSVGVGASVKKKFFGLWKYNTGFMGFLVFTPVPRTKTNLLYPAVDLFMDGFDSDEKGFGTSRVKINLRQGFVKCRNTAERFVARASKAPARTWYVSDIKSIYDVSKTGIFGLADVSSRGVIEIDYKRVNP
jgi:hypothetical protein